MAVFLYKRPKIAVIGPYGESRLTLGFWASVSGKPQDAVPLKEGLLKNFIHRAKFNLLVAIICLTLMTGLVPSKLGLRC